MASNASQGFPSVAALIRLLAQLDAVVERQRARALPQAPRDGTKEISAKDA